MDLIEEINKQIDRGFTKTQLEKLLQLPKNNLSSYLSGKKEMSRVSKIKVETLIKNVYAINPFEAIKDEKKVNLNNLTNNPKDTNRVINTKETDNCVIKTVYQKFEPKELSDSTLSKLVVDIKNELSVLVGKHPLVVKNKKILESKLSDVEWELSRRK